MCNVSDYVWEKAMTEGRAAGMAEGRAEGRAEGEFSAYRQVILNLHKANEPLEKIAAATSMSIEAVKQILSANS